MTLSVTALKLATGACVGRILEEDVLMLELIMQALCCPPIMHVQGQLGPWEVVKWARLRLGY